MDGNGEFGVEGDVLRGEIKLKGWKVDMVLLSSLLINAAIAVLLAKYEKEGKG